MFVFPSFFLFNMKREKNLVSIFLWFFNFFKDDKRQIGS